MANIKINQTGMRVIAGFQNGSRGKATLGCAVTAGVIQQLDPVVMAMSGASGSLTKAAKWFGATQQKSLGYGACLKVIQESFKAADQGQKAKACAVTGPNITVGRIRPYERSVRALPVSSGLAERVTQQVAMRRGLYSVLGLSYSPFLTLTILRWIGSLTDIITEWFKKKEERAADTDRSVAGKQNSSKPESIGECCPPDGSACGFKYVTPLDGELKITSDYGHRKSGEHYGIDIRAKEGSALKSIVSGIVKCIKREAFGKKGHKGGNEIFILGEDGHLYHYAHLQSFDESIISRIENGEAVRVEAGQEIGKTGHTGYYKKEDGSFGTLGAHLHLSIYKADKQSSSYKGTEDPEQWLSKMGITIK